MKRLLLPILAAVLVSCQDREPAPTPQQLVVEGWIENGAHPVVILTRTLPVVIGKEFTAGDIAHNILRRAKVVVNDGTQDYELKGAIDIDVFPPYRYSTDALVGEVGKTYTLRVEYQDQVVTGETTIPEPVPIDRAYVREVTGGFGTLACAFTDPEAPGNYYKVFTRTKGKDGDYIPTAFGMVADEDLDRSTAEIFIFCNMRILEGYGRPNIEEGDVVSVKLRSMTRESYDFWSTYDIRVNNTAFSLRAQDTQRLSTLQGGLGYWIGYGVAEPVTVTVTAP